MEIDLNNKTIDFYEFPSNAVANIKQLSFKKHSFNFEKLVELFEQISELKITAEEFNNTKQSFVRQKKLEKVDICCNYSDFNHSSKNPDLYDEHNVLKDNYEICYHIVLDGRFGLIFWDSS